MITCADCRQRLLPDDPRIRSGKYHLSGCDYYCNKPDYYREIEAEREPQIIEHRHSDMGKKEFDLLQQTALKVDWLEKRLNERKPHAKYLYY